MAICFSSSARNMTEIFDPAAESAFDACLLEFASTLLTEIAMFDRPLLDASEMDLSLSKGLNSVPRFYP